MQLLTEKTMSEPVVIRIPDSDIVVTRKVPMTDETCDQLRTIKADREVFFSEQLGEPVTLPIPTLIMQLIGEEHQRVEFAKTIH